MLSYKREPTVTMSGPTSATVGQPLTFTATATGGTYTYAWSFGASGPTATYTFTAPGTQTIGVTVTDNCGKSATAMYTGAVSEGSGGTGNLTGRWVGTISDNRGVTGQFEMQLQQVGVNVTASVFIGGLATTGNGSYANGQFQLQFQWPGITIVVTLVGSYNPYASELYGDWLVGGQKGGSWRVRR
ncbi:MAG: PKD domain-containing protein [Candidatus Bipolaricaulaceae bacterium]